MGITDKMVLVTGATGQQGGAVARHLRAAGWRVRAFTRRPESDQAAALAALGAEIFAGDLDDRTSLGAALRGVYGVFSVQVVDPEKELRQGTAVADASASAGVEHLVYSSVGGADRSTGVAHYAHKWQIEQHIHALQLPATILRPVQFMDNYQRMRAMITNGIFPRFGLRPERAVQLIAVEDIGAFAALAFAHPDAYRGRTTEIAGDELTETEIAAVFARALGRAVRLSDEPFIPWITTPDAVREYEDVLTWYNEQGYQADISALRRLHPNLLTLDAWAQRTGWDHAAPLPMPRGPFGR